MINKITPCEEWRHKTTQREEQHRIWPMINLILLRIEMIILPKGNRKLKKLSLGKSP